MPLLGGEPSPNEGHGFSRAVEYAIGEGFSCGYRGKNRRLSPRYPLSPWGTVTEHLGFVRHG
jgi:hypothetical protein